ncbi:DUF2087 domain-containing protein [Microcella humidisoli]|uniref:DUF2087 domain-containing protein n=1 Tax=Microcella humidisoli TaxID=2963406 RepID=A0ABY5FWC1_9MICO|nr:DUF2087 domain-containing protein [Microcella humidisoli]UTT62237.1 DUF2087 domain-containing protein [Microcella humidisoli]
MTDEKNAWRGVIAALANPESRRVLGLLLSEQDASAHLASLPLKRRERVLRVLADAGLLDPSSDRPRLRPERFAELLDAAPVARPTGIDRFIVDGRLDHYPARSDDRAAVLQYLVHRAMPDATELVDERTLTERLAALSDDPVTMRRYLVDAGLLVREPDGSAYRHAAPSER